MFFPLNPYVSCKRNVTELYSLLVLYGQDFGSQTKVMVTTGKLCQANLTFITQLPGKRGVHAFPAVLVFLHLEERSIQR